jgi:putative flippase GtrA
LEITSKIKEIVPEVLRFSLTGGLSTAVHFAMVALLVSFMRFLPPHANIIAFLLAFGVSYFGHSKYTFPNSGRTGLDPALIKFFIVAILSFAMNESLYIYLLKTMQQYNYLLVLIFDLSIVGTVTFCLCKLWAFKPTLKR